MECSKRISQALQHTEPDRIPFDFGGTRVTGITLAAYRNLLDHLGIRKENIPLVDFTQRLVEVDEEVLRKLKVDTRGLVPQFSIDDIDLREEGQYTYLVDDWGIKWKMPKEKGEYYDMAGHPLAGEITKGEIENHPFPDPCDPARTENMEKKAKLLKSEGFPLILGRQGAGLFGMGLWLRGFNDFYTDLVTRPSLACRLMDRLLEWSMDFWKSCLDKLGQYVLIIQEGDDFAGQNGLLISPYLYRTHIKPRQRTLFSYIKKEAKSGTHILFHSCGSVYEIIPDLIEIGVDILNPVQVSAANMDTKRLKKEFGEDLTFWGGGVDTQRILPHGAPQDVKDEVKRRIDDLAPGGGFVFSTVHNIQSDVPPQNIMAMWEAFQEYGKYSP